jgi:hypothetical protein
MFAIEKDTRNGLDYIETSAAWKKLCEPLPCFAELWWPDYLTKVVRLEIDGKSVIIQLWKGWCQRFLGRWANFPGGMGAEVGIYRKIASDEGPGDGYLFEKPVKAIDRTLHKVRKDLRKVPAKIKPLKKITDQLPRRDHPDGDPEGEVWYPYPELNTRLWFKLVNPYNGETFFETEKQTTYWLTRWMAPDSYRRKYQKEHATPMFAAQYKLYYTVNGTSYEW